MTTSLFPIDSQTDATSLTAPRVSLRVILLSAAAFWFFYFCVITTSQLEHAEFWPRIPGRIIVSLCGVFLLMLQYQVLKRVERRPTWQFVGVSFLAAIPTALLYSAANYKIMEIVPKLFAPSMGWMDHGPAWESIMFLALEWYTFIAAWGLLYIALCYGTRVFHAERTVAYYRAQAQSAQLRALRYQINPHFLFNTLNSISSLVLSRRTDDAERMILNLATFFRTSLTDDPCEDVPLSDEIQLQQLYLEIERARFPERLSIAIDIGKAPPDALVPGLILQPLVENAVKHGVARSIRAVTIRICAWQTGTQLHITVEDNGDPKFDIAPGTGVGLQNVRDRLATRFDGGASCRFGHSVDGGFRVDLTMPLRLKSEAGA